MSLFILSFLASLFATLAVGRSSAFHARISADHDFSGPQKFHASPVPRIGGIGVVLAMAAGGVSVEALRSDDSCGLWLLLVCAAPAFIVGIAEDLTKKVAARWRLLATALSGVLAVWLLHAVLPRTHIPGIDLLMPMWPFAVALTLLCVTGVANAINIIDGFNGLASMCVMMMILAI